VRSEFGGPIVCSTHPRTRDQLTRHGIPAPSPEIRLIDPLGFFEFVWLEKNARCVLSDSGTVQEECAIFNVPNLTLRDVTERPETVECGSNILTGADPGSIARAVQIALSRSGPWDPPPEYLARNVAESVVKIVLGHRQPLAR